jgi:hypothetical protein
MPVNDLHVHDAGGESCQVVVCGPGGAGKGSRSLDTDFDNGRFGTYLGVREDFFENIKRSRCKNKPVQKRKLLSKDKIHTLDFLIQLLDELGNGVLDHSKLLVPLLVKLSQFLFPPQLMAQLLLSLLHLLFPGSNGVLQRLGMMQPDLKQLLLHLGSFGSLGLQVALVLEGQLFFFS